MFDSNIILEDEVALLRPLDYDDYAHLLQYALHEPNIWHYSLVSAGGVDGLRNYIDTALAARQALREYAFIVWDKRQQKYAGSTRFYDISLNHKTLEIGYTWYAKDFQGTGLNKHCKFLLLSYAFDVLKMERVSFKADSNNKRSIAAMQSIGCTIEGILRNDLQKADGSRRSSIVLSILAAEWQGHVRAMLQTKISNLP